MAERPCSTVVLQGSPLGLRTIAVKSAPPRVIVKRNGVVVASTTAAAAAVRRPPLSRSGTPPLPVQSGSAEDMRILKVGVAIEAQIKLDPDDPLAGSVSVVAVPRPTIAKEKKKKKKKKTEKPVSKQQGDTKQNEEPAKKPAKFSSKTGDQTITPNSIKNSAIWDSPIQPIVPAKALIADRAKYFALSATEEKNSSAGLDSGRETLIPPQIVPDRLKHFRRLQGKNQRKNPDRRGSEQGGLARIPSIIDRRRNSQVEAARTSSLDRDQGIARTPPSMDCRRCSQQEAVRVPSLDQAQGEQGFVRTPMDRCRAVGTPAKGFPRTSFTAAEQGFVRTPSSTDRRRSSAVGTPPVNREQEFVSTDRRRSSAVWTPSVNREQEFVSTDRRRSSAVWTPPVNRDQEFVSTDRRRSSAVGTPPVKEFVRSSSMERRVSNYHIQNQQGTTDASTEDSSSSSSPGSLTPRNFQSARHELHGSWTDGTTRNNSSPGRNWKVFAPGRDRGTGRSSCIDRSEEDRLQQMQRAYEQRRRRQTPDAGRPRRSCIAPFACQIQEVMENIYGDLDGPPRRRKSLQKSCCIKPLHSRIEEVMGTLFGEKQQQQQQRAKRNRS